MTTPLAIALLQFNPLCGAVEHNTTRLLKHIEQHQQQGTDLLCLPEFAVCGYPPEDLLFRPAFHAAIKEALHRICQHVTGDFSLLISYPHQDDHGMSNRVSLIQDGTIQLNYDKRALPNSHTFDEKRYFRPGETAVSFTVRGHHLGVLICEDVWCDSILADTVALGTETLIILNASPYTIDKQNRRIERLKQIAKQHQQHCLYLNLTGGQDELVFDGRSLVLNKDGILCQQAKAFSEDTLLISLSQELTPNTPSQPPESSDATLYQALVYGVREYVSKNHFPGVLLGLSGGIDSALTLAIAVDALGADKVHAVMMPTRFTSKASLNDAQTNADALGVTYDVIDIEALFQSAKDTLLPHFHGKAADTTEENIQARLRGMLLMGLSNKHGKLVLCTGNKSEMAVGYSTLYGDLAGGFSPLKDIFKTTVYRLCKYRNHLSPVIPANILEKAPSAELADNQRDDDTLPPYPVLDALLKQAIHREASPNKLRSLGFDDNTIRIVMTRLYRNEYKRRQTAIGIRVSTHAFGRDRRYPITQWYPEDIFDAY